METQTVEMQTSVLTAVRRWMIVGLTLYIFAHAASNTVLDIRVSVSIMESSPVLGLGSIIHGLFSGVLAVSCLVLLRYKFSKENASGKLMSSLSILMISISLHWLGFILWMLLSDIALGSGINALDMTLLALIVLILISVYAWYRIYKQDDTALTAVRNLNYVFLALTIICSAVFASETLSPSSFEWTEFLLAAWVISVAWSMLVLHAIATWMAFEQFGPELPEAPPEEDELRYT